MGLPAMESRTQSRQPKQTHRVNFMEDEFAVASEADIVNRQELVSNMRRYGGNFVEKLGDAMMAADPVNFAKLYTAFPEIVEKYSEAQS
jgi:hypothetical protein